jgi:hypothetical protein
MAIRWDITRIQNNDDLYIPGVNNPMGGWKPVKPGTEDDKYLNHITNALIWSCVAVELNGITEENFEEFFIRLHIWERVSGPSCYGPKGESEHLTLADVKRHIGLHVNTSNKSRTFFLRKVNNYLVKQAEDDLKSDDKSILEIYRQRLEEKFMEVAPE